MFLMITNNAIGN